MPMTTEKPARIFWPALGAPALLTPEARVLTIVVEPPEDPRRELVFWLEAVPGRTRYPLVERSRSERVNPRIHGNRFAGHLRDRTFLEVELEVPAVEDGAGTPRISLFDLHGSAHAPSRHAVAVRSTGDDDLRFDYIADPHVASMWDEVEEQISGVPAATEAKNPIDRLFGREVLRENFLNPNTALADFVKRCNAAARRGEVDLLVVGGDLVDYVYQRPRKETVDRYENTNFWLYEQIVTGARHGCEELLVPMLTTTGNHDYRLYPYRLFSYGLRHCGVHHWQTAAFLERIPRKPFWIPNRADIDSISASKGRRHSLAHYHRHINPFDDFVVGVGRSTFVLLDTGRDAMFAVRDVGIGRMRQLVSSVLFGGDDPDSEGLSDQQIELLWNAVRETGANHLFLVFHAGLLNSYPDQEISEWEMVRPGTDTRVGSSCEYRLPLHFRMDGESSRERNLRFEAELKRQRLANGCIFRNHLEVLRAAAEFRGNFVGLSGHAHRNLELRVDVERGTVAVSDYTSSGVTKRTGDASALFLMPNALGHAQPKFDLLNPPQSYRLQVRDEKELCARRFVALPEGFDEFVFFARVVSRSEREVVLGCELSTRRTEAGAIRLTLVREGKSPLPWSGTVEEPVSRSLHTIPFRPSHFERIDIRSTFEAQEVEIPFSASVVIRIAGKEQLSGDLSIVCELLEREGGGRVMGTQWHPRALLLA